jgi:hypothetical protein
MPYAPFISPVEWHSYRRFQIYSLSSPVDYCVTRGRVIDKAIHALKDKGFVIVELPPVPSYELYKLIVRPLEEASNIKAKGGG